MRIGIARGNLPEAGFPVKPLYFLQQLHVRRKDFSESDPTPDNKTVLNPTLKKSRFCFRLSRKTVTGPFMNNRNNILNEQILRNCANAFQDPVDANLQYVPLGLAVAASSK